MKTVTVRMCQECPAFGLEPGISDVILLCSAGGTPQSYCTVPEDCPLRLEPMRVQLADDYRKEP